MELMVKTPTFPEVIEFNFEELKQEITNKASEYMNLVYSEDQIQDAKKDRAALNKFVKALSDERIKIKKECLKPYEDFERKIKELDGIVNKAILNIDGQVKGFEEQKKEERKQAIVEYFESHPSIEGFETLQLEQIFNEKWLNASVSIKTVCAEIDARLGQIMTDLETLSNLPDFSFEAINEYKQSLDINKAITEGHRLSEIQKRKAEAEKETLPFEVERTGEVENPTLLSPELRNRQWISFKAHLTVQQATELKNFFNSRNIEFEAI